MRKIVLGIAGSSGSVYAQALIKKLATISDLEVGVVMSTNAITNWEIEIGKFDASQIPFKVYGKQDFNAPFASGSAQYDTMIICPSSTGIIGRVATGISNDLMTRAADVILKERRKLIIVPRETPYSLIHLRNMTTITEAGGIICPACPSFYSSPESIDDIILTVVDRIIDLAQLKQSTYRWGE
jgi:4-hydroxy-3-polyprenylbenzoate decarboxylase